MTLKNTGTVPVVLGATPFTVYAPFNLVAGSNCTGTLAVSATCTASFTFSPPAVGAFSGKYLAVTSTPAPRIVPPFAGRAPSPVVEVVSGGSSYLTFVRRQDGTWWATGSNFNGGLGLGDNVDRPSYVQVPALAGATKVYTNGGASFAIMADGSVKATGANNGGGLGLGDKVSRNVFTTVPGVTAQKLVLGLASTTYLQKPDGTWWGAGSNSTGDLGLGDAVARTTFTPLSLPANTVNIVLGRATAFALNTSGAWFSTGTNFYGQLGLGDMTSRTTFTPMSLPAGATIFASDYDTYVKYSNNTWGEAGWSTYVTVDSNATSNTTFQPISSFSGAISLVTGFQTAFFRYADNSVKAAGVDYYGQLGGGSFNQYPKGFSQPALAPATTIVPNAVGTFGLLSDGTLLVSGQNDYLGLGTSDGTKTYTFFRMIP